MGYFDGLTDGLFKEDDQGRTLFFPFGIFGKGKVLPNESAKKEIRKLVKRYYQIMVPVMIVLSVLVGFFSLFGWLWVSVVALISVIPYSLLTYKQIGKFEKANSSLSYLESLRNSAQSHDKFTLWLLFISCIIFFIANLVYILNNPLAWISGGLSALLFGSCAFFFGYMIKVKDT